ncbi:FKBP-type peptidyl-prolyl cis-trans isomerase [Verrucomicrobiales bacterium]|nr:FKBP-type peptidyl-prolyl cis-trans isomerase [Verrucomicrobiales bacterium]
MKLPTLTRFFVISAVASVLSSNVNAQDLKAPADVAAPPKDAIKEDSGLASKVLTKGSGTRKPKATDQVKVHYTGWTTDGEMFDSSVKRGTPSTFGLNQVIKGWTEGLQLMVEGEKRRFWIPAGMAYGENPAGGRPGGMLCFDVELIENLSPEPPKTPEDVAAVPDTASTTASGLASRVLKEGTGTTKPKATSTVTVHYSGWTTDGKLFDSSVERGRPASFGLNQVISGWTEGVQLMVQGEKRRFWIPEELGYGKVPPPGAPAGMLVFDVELIGVE